MQNPLDDTLTALVGDLIFTYNTKQFAVDGTQVSVSVSDFGWMGVRWTTPDGQYNALLGDDWGEWPASDKEKETAIALLDKGIKQLENAGV